MTRLHPSPPDGDEDDRATLICALDGGWTAPSGLEVGAFEADLARTTGWDHCAALSSATAALHLAPDLLVVGPGDRLLVSLPTWTAAAGRYAGAEPFPPGSDLTAWNMDSELRGGALGLGQYAARVPVDTHRPERRLRALRPWLGLGTGNKVVTIDGGVLGGGNQESMRRARCVSTQVRHPTLSKQLLENGPCTSAPSSLTPGQRDPVVAGFREVLGRS